MRSVFSWMICLTLVITIALTGCRRMYQTETDTMSETGIETISIPSGSEAQTLEASGGTDAWIKTKQLRLNCVVAFYQPDDSYYLTEQLYDIYPWSKSIRISFVVPKGKFVWQLTDGRFAAMAGGDRFDGFPAALEARSLAELVLDIIIAPVYFLDSSVVFSSETVPVRIQGQWYQPMSEMNMFEILPEVYFYQNMGNYRIDTIYYPVMSRSKSLMVRGYEYKPVEKNGVLVPTDIEIYNTDIEGQPTKRLVRISCQTIERIE